MGIGKELTFIARQIMAKNAEEEVERLFKYILKGTIFQNKTWAVGGYVRDQILGMESKDLDIVVELKDGAKNLTNYVHKIFSTETTRPHQLSERYPIWQISFIENITANNDLFLTKGAVIEIADTLREKFPDINSRQRTVEHGTIQQDLEKRDMTVNMMLKDMTTGEFVDMTGQSKADIQKGILRGHPDVDFGEILSADPLRMLRLARFAVKYGWTVPLSVLRTVKANASRIEIISEERVRDELIKIMKLGKLAQAIKFFESTGLLKYIFPEIQALKGVPQNKEYHSEGDAYRHTMMVLKSAPAGIENQLSALLHDAGKASTTELIDGSIHSYGHEKVSGEIAEAVLRRLKFDLPTIKNVRKIVENHMRPHALHDAGAAGIRKFIREVGEELVDAVMDLASADERGKIPSINSIPGLKKKVDDVRRFTPPKKNKAVLDGNEIMKILDIRPGSKIKEVSDYLLDLEDNFVEKGKVLDKETAKNAILDKFGK